MRVLVTNDDGVDAPGLVAVARALVDAGHQVVVGAPAADRSGSGSSLGTIEDAAVIATTEKRIPELGDTPVIALDCPPALIAVAFCAGAYGPPPDLVVSGVNDGHNTGRSILFSSTVGAVLAAGVAGIGGIAVSSGFAPHHRHDTASAVAARVVDWMAASGSMRLSLNVNVPGRPMEDLRGVRVTRLAAQSMFSLRMEPTETGLLLRRDERSDGFRDGTDSAAIAEGYVSITPLRGVTHDVDVVADPGSLAEVDLLPGTVNLR